LECKKEESVSQDCRLERETERERIVRAFRRIADQSESEERERIVRAFRRIADQSEKQSEKRSEAELQLYEASSYDLVIDSRQDVESCWKG